MAGLSRMFKGEARNVLIFTASNGINRLGGLLLIPLYWTVLRPSDYGVLAVVAIIGAFQALLSSLSLDLAITRFYYEWSESSRRANVGAIWCWNWIITAAVGVSFLAAFTVLGPLLFPDVPYMPWLFLGIVANTLANLAVIPASTIRIKRLPWLFASYNLFGFLTAASLGLWLVLVLNQGLRGLLLSMIVSNFLVAAFGAIVMLRFATVTWWSPGLAEAFRFSLPATPSLVIGTVSTVLDRFLVSSFMSLQALGLYSVALRFVEVLAALHNSLKMSYGPFMVKQITAGGERGKAQVALTTPYYLLPYFVVGVGLTIFIGPLVRFIGQPEYFGIEAIVPWLAGVQIISSMSLYFCNGLFFGKRNDLQTIPAAIHLAIFVPTSFILIPPFQLGGVVAGRYAGAVAFFAVSAYLSQRVFPFSHRWAAALRMAAAAVAFAAVGVSIPSDAVAFELAAKAAVLAGFVAVCLLIVNVERRLPWTRSASIS